MNTTHPTAKVRSLLLTTVGALALGSSVLTACSPKDDQVVRVPTVVANTTDPKWVSQSNPHAKVAVVFVHGVFGDTLGTWTNSNGTTFFQNLKASPQVGSQVDVFAFGFTSNMLGAGSLDIRESANKLHESLQYKDVLDYPAIVFVAHSMGGLVVLRHLISHPELAQKVPVVVLYATPQEGAQISVIADKVARNPALAQMLPSDNNDHLQQLSDDWRRLPNRPRVSCGYETRPTYGAMIVPWTSATRFCDDTPIAIENADHIDIVKPDRMEHGSVVLLVNALNRHVMGKNFAARLDTPDFTPEGDHFVFKLDARQRNARLVNAGRGNLRYTVAEVSDPSLYIVPDDTPKDIRGEETQRLGLNLLAGAEASEYTFVLRSDVPSEQKVVVRVPDIEVIRRGHAQLVGTVMNAMNAHLADPKNAAALKGLPDPKAYDEAARVAFDAIAKQSPDLPANANWIVTADMLSSANWPQFAVSALRRAETVSAATAGTPSAQRLAGIVAAQSGVMRIFTTTSTPIAPTTTPKTLRWLGSSKQAEDSVLLASRLQQVPALRAAGLSLEGDVMRFKGDNDAALKAYVAAESIESTSSIVMRIEALDATDSTAPGRIKFMAKGTAATKETAALKRDGQRVEAKAMAVERAKVRP